MAQFSVNTQRFDPYKNFKFRVKWDGRYVAGVSKVSALKRTTEVVKHREGGDPSSSAQVARAGRSTRPITLERGVTHDPEFEQWANKVWNFGSGLGAEVSLKDFRKDIIIEVYNEAGPAGARLQASSAAGCRSTRRCPSSTPTPTPSRSRHSSSRTRAGSATYDVTEPSEPTFTEPAVTAAVSWWALVDAWDRGLACGPVGRAGVLWELSARSREVADPTVGQRDLTLLGLFGELFGDVLDAVTRCPACAAPLEVRLSAAALAVGGVPALAAECVTDGYMVRVRPLTHGDLADAVRPGDVDADGLLARGVLSVTRDGSACAVADLPAAARAAVAAALAAPTRARTS